MRQLVLLSILLIGCNTTKEDHLQKFSTDYFDCVNELPISKIHEKREALKLPNTLSHDQRLNIAKYIVNSEILNCITERFEK